MTQMPYRSLGTSGLMVSAVGLGCNNFGRAGTATQTLEGTRAVLDAAIDAGVTLLDTADSYLEPRGISETLMGQALRGKRDQVILATKFGADMRGANGPDWGARGSRRYVRIAVEASLRRLQTDWIDLYQLHFPDPHTPIEETVQVLDTLVQEGKIRYFGHSNLTARQIDEADAAARQAGGCRFVSAQNEYSLLRRDVEDGVLDAVRRAGMGLLPFFPLFNGLLTGKFTRQGGPEDSRIMQAKPHLVDQAPWDRLERLQSFCDDHGVSMTTVAIGWLLRQDGVSSVIAGATSAEQIVANATSVGQWDPTPEEIAEVSAIMARDEVA